jgi:hypothetical protein
MRIIGLTGRARSGKDTVAGILADELGGNVVRQGFADKLKLSAARIFHPEYDVEQAIAWCNVVKEGARLGAGVDFEWGYESVGSCTGREFLQRYGTEAHRDVFGEDFWLDAVLPAGRDDADVLVIPDVRFVNEAERVRARGGELWEIRRPGVGIGEAHVSEAGIPGTLWTCLLHNDGDIDDLRTVVRGLLGVRA